MTVVGVVSSGRPDTKLSWEILFAGFGGQGIMVAGQLLAYAAMMEGKNVSWIPSYGPEMRGGTANCAVVIAQGSIPSPVVSEPDVLVAMNRPSMEKFEVMLNPGGTLLYNSSLIDTRPGRRDITVVPVPANEVADELGNTRIANMVALGALLGCLPVATPESVVESMRKVFPPRRHDMIPLNAEALKRGLRLTVAPTQGC